MPPNGAGDAAGRKRVIRERARARRRAQPDKDELSRRIVARLRDRPEYAAAQTVLYYIDTLHEVRTRHDLPAALNCGKRIVVPYCVDGQLQLFRLESMDELARGAHGILEPREALRVIPSRQVVVQELDLIIVPGVAFDRQCARTGQGKGYYDRLLASARRDALLAGLAFECQVFDEIPVAEHDICMDLVITEQAIYTGRGRSRAAHAAP
jgi:5-formyltetrahydrofolate cyclo-ligase